MPKDEEFEGLNDIQESNQAFRIRVIFQLKAVLREIEYLKVESEREDSALGRSIEILTEETNKLKNTIDNMKADTIRIATIITIAGAAIAIILPLIWSNVMS